MNQPLSEDYSDIINLPAWEPKTRKRMPLEARGAQFAPFNALDRYTECIKEEQRLTESKFNNEYTGE